MEAGAKAFQLLVLIPEFKSRMARDNDSKQRVIFIVSRQMLRVRSRQGDGDLDAFLVDWGRRLLGLSSSLQHCNSIAEVVIFRFERGDTLFGVHLFDLRFAASFST
jgi:hypothetical protein